MTYDFYVQVSWIRQRDLRDLVTYHLSAQVYWIRQHDLYGS
jgi:hypothetical protein